MVTFEEYRKLLHGNTEGLVGDFASLNEMAIPLKRYRERADALRFVLVENWCLCEYCRLFDGESENFIHWQIELSAVIKNLKMLDVKGGDKRQTLERMFVQDYDYDKPEMILRIIADKFSAEGIDDTVQREEVVGGFAKGIHSLIELICDNTLSIDEYLKKTFVDTKIER